MKRVAINIVLILIMVAAFLYTAITIAEPQLGWPKFWGYLVMALCFISLRRDKPSIKQADESTVEPLEIQTDVSKVKKKT